jgi:hypothetical protein
MSQDQVRGQVSPCGICGSYTKRHWDRLSSESYDFPLSISFHRCSIFSLTSSGGWIKGPLEAQFRRDIVSLHRKKITNPLFTDGDIKYNLVVWQHRIYIWHNGRNTLPTFLEGGGGASECLDDGCGGDVVDFLVTTRVGVSSSRCCMEWLCRVCRPAILHSTVQN